jgi:hypothetical protein
LAGKLAGAAGISEGVLRRGLQVSGRSAFLELPEEETQKVAALHGQTLEDKPLRVEPARSTPRRRRK